MPPSFAIRSAAGLSLLVATALSIGGCGKDDTATGGSTPATSTTPVQLDTQTVAKAIKQSIKDQRGIRAHVTCPPTVVQAKDQDFVCLAVVKGVTTKFAVVQTDDAGHVTYAAAQ